jgi:hypothetical protein
MQKPKPIRIERRGPAPSIMGPATRRLTTVAIYCAEMTSPASTGPTCATPTAQPDRTASGRPTEK